MNTNEISLTSNGIEQLQLIDPSANINTTPKAINIVLQVHQTKKSETKNDDFCTFKAILADMSYKYFGFIIQSKVGQRELGLGDIIKLKLINVTIHNENKVFIVREFETLGINHKFLSNPEFYRLPGFEQNKNNSIAISNDNNGEDDRRMPDPDEENDDFQESKKKTQLVKSEHTRSNDDSILLSHITTFTKDIVIYVKVIKKWEVKNFTNKQTKQPGKLLSFNIADVEGYEMQVTCFGSICDKIYSMIREDGVYYIRGGYARLSEKRYTNIKGDYKLIIDDKTKIEEVEDNGRFKKAKSDIIEFRNLISIQVNTIIDCVAFVIEATDKTIKPTKGGEMSIRKLVVGDISGYKCELTLWRKFADMNIHQGEIIFLKYVRVGDFNGRSLSTVDDSTITTNPDMEERTKLENYLINKPVWQNIPNSNQVDGETNATITDLVYIKDLLNSISESNDSPLTRIKGTICTITHSEKNYYRGCPKNTCKKKLVQEGNGWICLVCQTIYDKPYYYYTLSVRVKDASSEHWVDLFGETVKKLLGMDCEDYKDLIENKEDVKLKQLSNKIEFHTYYFVGKAKVQMYNNNPKKKFLAYRYEAVVSSAEAKRQVKEIKTLLLR